MEIRKGIPQRFEPGGDGLKRYIELISINKYG
jgi:hypothetical protein